MEWVPLLLLGGVAWLLLLATGWLAFVVWVRVRYQQRLEAREPYRRAALLGAFSADDGAEPSEATAAFQEEITRLRSRIQRQYGERIE